ncbi:hypothetical protein GQ53DRAFT_775047 [Thozetella sp. PMI_491]|nr:hypothetical protein GQ53DRAFT_775047 [Thozetella sp. PMI_491]
MATKSGLQRVPKWCKKGSSLVANIYPKHVAPVTAKYLCGTNADRASQNLKEVASSKAGTSLYRFNAWQNLGGGGAKLKGSPGRLLTLSVKQADGDRHCNMLGHSNGAMVYIWVHSTSHMILMRVWINQKKAQRDVGKWVEKPSGMAASDAACNQHRGVGIFDLVGKYSGDTVQHLPGEAEGGHNGDDSDSTTNPRVDWLAGI